MLSDEIIEKMKEMNFTEEQIDFVNDEVVKEVNHNNGYKIVCGKEYICRRQKGEGYCFYKISVSKKGLERKYSHALKPIVFLNCDPPNTDTSKIIIKSFFEDFYKNPKDQYTYIFPLKITDYELVDKETDEKIAEEKALKSYQNNIASEFDDIDISF